MAEAMLLELVEAHLDDELRLERRLLELSAPPAVRLAEAPVALLVEERQHLRCDLRLVLRADRGGADVVEVAVVVVEAEQERGDRVAPALLPADAGDDAVCGLVRLHLDDAVARAGEIREAEALRDDTVEARRLQRLEPLVPLLDVVRDGRELEAVPDLLELGAPFLDRPLVHRLALPEEQVEGDEGRRGSRPRACGRGSRPDGGASASRRSRARRPARSRSRRRARSAAGSRRRAARSSGKYRSSGRPLRDQSASSPPSFSSTPRKPSHFGSYRQPPPAGSSATSSASIGGNGTLGPGASAISAGT